MPSVFVSYAHEDKPVARALAEGLEAEGLRVWMMTKSCWPAGARLSPAYALLEFLEALALDIDVI